MTEEALSQKQDIPEIFDSSKPLVNSKLLYLSSLDDEGMQLLQHAWARADIERKRKIITSLVHLSESDLKLDFSRVFMFCLSEPDEDIRTQSIAGLEAEEDPIIIPHLLRVLEDASAKVRTAAAITLGNFTLQCALGELPSHYTDKIYASLLKVMDNKNETAEVKRRALEAIAPLNLPRVKEIIEKAYHSDDAKLKASAIYAMGRNCDPAWLSNIIVEMNSEQSEIRYEAANACSELADEEAVPHLIKLTRDSDVQVQEAAIRALGEIGGEEAKEILDKLAASPQPRIREAAKSAFQELQLCQDPLSPGQ